MCVERLGAGERAGRERDAGAPACDQFIHVSRLGAIERERSPGGELLREPVHSGEVNIDQLAGLVARQRLDADRAGQCDQREIEPIRPDEIGPPARCLTLDVDGPGLLAGAVQNRHPVGAAHERQAFPGGQGVEQRTGPQVLVDIGSSGWLSDHAREYNTKSIEFLMIQGMNRGVRIPGCPSRSADRCSPSPRASGSNARSARHGGARCSPTTWPRATWPAVPLTTR